MRGEKKKEPFEVLLEGFSEGGRGEQKDQKIQGYLGQVQGQIVFLIFVVVVNYVVGNILSQFPLSL